MKLVTGAYGFIGSNFVRYLNRLGMEDIIVCDYLTNGKQFTNLNKCKFVGYVTPDRLLSTFSDYSFTEVFHFGAISNTKEWNGELVMERNYQYTLDLLSQAVANKAAFSYSSSASVYGNGDGPMNLYAYSKYLVDKAIEPLLNDLDIKVQGFRYFNVYGRNEDHKLGQASPYHTFKKQALETGEIRIFEGSENYKRDFVPVERVCEVQFMMLHMGPSGIYDLGMGTQKSFKEVAEEVAKETGARIIEIPFPKELVGHYQTSTLADMGYLKDFSH